MATRNSQPCERIIRLTSNPTQPFNQLAQASRTQPRSQRCAGSASILGCQSNDTVISGVGTGRGKLCIPARKASVCRSGTLAIRSEFRASCSAVEKPLTMVAICRSSPSAFKASSIGPLSSPRRET